jgi:hypothetical protein
VAFPACWSYEAEADPDAREAGLRWSRDHRAELEAALSREGAVLVRGLPLRDAADFDAFVALFERPNFAYRRSLSNAVRVERTERVFTANEAPPDTEIRLHHELAQTPVFPATLFFFCEKPAEQGGATPLCRSDLLYEVLLRDRPGFARDCESHGLVYQLVMPPRDDAGSGQGRGWRSTFDTADRAGAESRMRALGYRWEWLPGDCLRATTPVLPGVCRLPDGRTSFFNQLIATLGWSDARNEGGRSVTLGDGRPIDAEALCHAGRLAESLCADVAWQRGDVAWVDNRLVMHGRRRFRGTRSVLASLAADA